MLSRGGQVLSLRPQSSKQCGLQELGLAFSRANSIPNIMSASLSPSPCLQDKLVLGSGWSGWDHLGFYNLFPFPVSYSPLHPSECLTEMGVCLGVIM